VVYLAFWTTTLVPGWASVVALQCIFSGMILLALGAIGDYVARIYEESKNRPLYVVTETYNLRLSDKSKQQLTRAVILAQSGPLDCLAKPGDAYLRQENEDTASHHSLVGSGT
jgi:hypothetical protein